MLALGAIVRDELLRGACGRSRQIDGERRAGKRCQDQECGEPGCKPGLQPFASMRPREHRHSGDLRRDRTPPDRGTSRQQLKMILAGNTVKSH